MEQFVQMMDLVLFQMTHINCIGKVKIQQLLIIALGQKMYGKQK